MPPSARISDPVGPRKIWCLPIHDTRTFREMAAAMTIMKSQLEVCGAPMMMVDHKYHENLTTEAVDEILDGLK